MQWPLPSRHWFWRYFKIRKKTKKYDHYWVEQWEPSGTLGNFPLNQKIRRGQISKRGFIVVPTIYKGLNDKIPIKCKMPGHHWVLWENDNMEAKKLQMFLCPLLGSGGQKWWNNVIEVHRLNVGVAHKMIGHQIIYYKIIPSLPYTEVQLLQTVCVVGNWWSNYLALPMEPSTPSQH